MASKQLIDTYNTKDTLVVISTYPRTGQIHSNGVCAMAPFTKNLLRSFYEGNLNKPCVVLAAKIPGEKDVAEEENTLVIRCFSRNHPLSFFSLIFQIFRLSKTHTYLISFEFASFGDSIATIFFLLPVWLLLLLGKQTTIILHQAVLDIKTLSKHIGLSKDDRFKAFFLNISLRLYYYILFLPVRQVVVLEKPLKQKAQQIVGSKSITIIPLAVEKPIKLISKEAAREKLGLAPDEYYVLAFGYLTWYKGSDFLVDTFHRKIVIEKRPVKLLLGGGASFTQATKPHYQRFVHNMEDSLATAKSIVHTGFIPEENIPFYFAASDLVVFPYRICMASSGPLSLSLSYHKPFLLSLQLCDLLQEENIQLLLQNLHLYPDELLFTLTRRSFLRKLKQTLQKPLSEKITEFSKQLAEQRSPIIVQKLYQNILYPKEREQISLAPTLDYV